MVEIKFACYKVNNCDEVFDFPISSGFGSGGLNH